MSGYTISPTANLALKDVHFLHVSGRRGLGDRSPSQSTFNTPTAAPPFAKVGLALVGYTPMGMKDASFGTNGLVFMDGSGSGIARDTQDRIVAVGSNHAPAAMIPRVRDDGSIESTNVDADVPGGYTNVDFDPAGRYVAIGNAGGTNVVHARYTASGRDPSFGTDGFAEAVLLPGTYRYGADIAVQPDGRIVTVGGYGYSDRTDGFVARHCP